MAGTQQLDDLDRQLVAMLSRDARVSNRRIAAELGVTEGTVRGRIKRLQSDGLLSFTAITSVDLGTANKLAFIGVQADMGNLRDIDLLVVLGSIDELPDLLMNKFGRIRGIRSMIPAITVDIVKYQFDVAPIEAREV